jgi:hypothetical protein
MMRKFEGSPSGPVSEGVEGDETCSSSSFSIEGFSSDDSLDELLEESLEELLEKSLEELLEESLDESLEESLDASEGPPCGVMMLSGNVGTISLGPFAAGKTSSGGPFAADWTGSWRCFVPGLVTSSDLVFAEDGAFCGRRLVLDDENPRLPPPGGSW